MASKVLIAVVAVLCLALIWMSFDTPTKCRLINGTNICNFYEVRQGDWTFDEKMELCSQMSDAPEKDHCYEIAAKSVDDEEKSGRACDQIRGFEGVYSKENCIKNPSLKAGA